MTLTDWLAIYGAVLSSALALLEIVKFNRRIRVTCKIAITEITNNIPFRALCIDVVNIGNRPITITQAGLMMSNKQKFSQLATRLCDNPLPKLLNDGENITIYLDYQMALQVIKGLDISYTAAYVSDAEGKLYKTKLPKNFGK